jgi:hypothetical protein
MNTSFNPDTRVPMPSSPALAGMPKIRSRWRSLAQGRSIDFRGPRATKHQGALVHSDEAFLGRGAWPPTLEKYLMISIYIKFLMLLKVSA